MGPQSPAVLEKNLRAAPPFAVLYTDDGAPGIGHGVRGWGKPQVEDVAQRVAWGRGRGTPHGVGVVRGLGHVRGKHGKFRVLLAALQ